ncbi:MAG TPA: hypothetical protein VGN24_08595 [Rhodanobacter sp.]|jgi:outer membrane murein-binding lipoprotein Lpp|nr:hypothetical protein [Rhodanobacter sp.]
MRSSLLFALALAGIGLTGCTSHETQTYVVTDSALNYLTLGDGRVAVHAPHHKDAVITEAGDLSLAGVDVKVTPPQRKLLMRYYESAAGFRDLGMSTSKGGVATASSLLVSAVAERANGDSQKLEREVNARVARITSTVSEMCNDLATLTATQNALASQLTEFRPYAQIKGNEAVECRRGLEDFAAKSQTRS